MNGFGYSIFIKPDKSGLIETQFFHELTSEAIGERDVVRINGKETERVMSYQMFVKVIKKAAKKTGINKRVHPHILTHSRTKNHYLACLRKAACP
ncbi:MAG: hypothetical protein QXF06_01830 [Archaeoglobaceae archaeon]